MERVADKPRVLIARRMPEATIARARAEFDAVIADRDLNADAVIEACHAKGIEAILSGKKAGFTASDIARLPASVKIIANPSAGYDHMDVEAARGRGIIVTNAPDALTDCVADFTLLLILAACRRAAEYEAIMRDGWRRPFGLPDMLGRKIGGCRLGIVGMGRIGRAVAHRARAFGMTILYHNRNRLPPELEAGATYCATLAALLPQSDILSLNLPGGSDVLMTREAFARLPRGAVFVNAARGSLVDEDALIDALQSGQLFAAGLDVFRREPDFDERLAKLPNVFLTPHMGSATVATRNRMGFDALDNIAAVMAGKPPINPV
ncbi:D-glycerate dehydrogenase [Rhodovastum atsumiense]|uniref:D-glycerate dehydrogenase n=1 Tax=Rhodovastum atsumiense TaxID=504468 RepID=A0A5M6IPD3_9PROT|nr:D-glycerate dehydrogenase [Rhodovastum atsumiense]KAA5610130.1 D-glycerate dehydrogenase [Rhodovastum atsumiense]CAH2599219.1 D-glycerate dehydrogenase [Rhodovastum atsumiense]